MSADGGADLERTRGSARSPRSARGAHGSGTGTPREPGDYELCCRATDSAGNAQPLEAPWNLGGYANNEVHRVPVVVRDD